MLHKLDMSALQLVKAHSPRGVDSIAFSQILTNAVKTLQKAGQVVISGFANGHHCCKEGTQSKEKVLAGVTKQTRALKARLGCKARRCKADAESKKEDARRVQEARKRCKEASWSNT